MLFQEMVGERRVTWTIRYGAVSSQLLNGLHIEWTENLLGQSRCVILRKYFGCLGIFTGAHRLDQPIGYR